MFTLYQTRSGYYLTPPPYAVGAGRVLFFGPDVTFRGQPHGTFKFLFNGIFYGRTEASP